MMTYSTTTSSAAAAFSANVNPPEGIEEAPRLRVGSNRCQCVQCGQFFGSVTGFDKHQQRTRDGNVSCLSSDEMWRKGMVQGPTGWWYASTATWAPQETDCDGANA